MAKASDYLIVLDDGHGSATAGKRTPYIKSLGRQIRENEFNKPTVNYLEAELKRCGFRTLQTAPTDADVPLNTRVRTANNAKADLFVSIHFNAMDGKFDGPGKDPSGFSAHIDPGSGSRVFAGIALKHLSKGTPQKNRGIVEQNLAVTRDTRMHAVLFELGFMDNEVEAMLMLNKDFQREVAQELAMAICEHFKVPYTYASVEAPSKPVEAPITAKGYLAPGDEGNAVKAMQTDFNKVGYKLSVDGSFGPATEKVVRDFQRSKRLVVDGFFGPNTQKVLEESIKVLTAPLHRVKVDGTQVGAYTEDKNVLSAVEDALKRKAKNITIERA